jgi:Holliday junction resolvase RusA-like endonuclease
MVMSRIRKVKGYIRFTVYGIAKPKGMPRVVRNKNTGKVHAIPPAKEWENTFAGKSYRYKPEKIIEGPVALGILFYRPLLKSFSKKKKEQAIERNLLPTTKPDLKNLIASVEDALTGIFWIDDAQVIAYINVDGIPTGKYFGEVPRIEVLIREL